MHDRYRPTILQYLMHMLVHLTHQAFDHDTHKHLFRVLHMLQVSRHVHVEYSDELLVGVVIKGLVWQMHQKRYARMQQKMCEYS